MLCYIHIPFCASKCGYCGFNSLVNMIDFKEKYLDSLCVDLENELGKLDESRDSATNSRPIRGAKNRVQGRSSASADFLLESDKRGTPPKSEKAAAFWRVGGAGRGVQPFLQKETSESQSEKIVGDSRIAKMDSSRCRAQNDEFVDYFGDESPCNDKMGAFESLKDKFHSIYIGGGTPNTLNPSDYERIFKILSPKIAPNTEITMELNPNASPKETLSAFKDLGVNRFSIGVQSFCNDKLKLLERNHSPKIARKFIENALNCGVKVSIDLIYDTILDSPKSLRFELENALNLGVGHISCYALSIDKNSAFYLKNKNPVSESSLCYDLKAILESRGFMQYEVSNFALNHKSAHNLGYWAYRDYIGVGLGAVGKITSTNGIYRTYKNSDFGAYLANPSAFRRESLSQSDIRLEKIFLGLRSEVGVESVLIADKNRLDLLIKSGKIRAQNGKIYATNYFLADEITLWLDNANPTKI